MIKQQVLYQANTCYKTSAHCKLNHSLTAEVLQYKTTVFEQYKYSDFSCVKCFSNTKYIFLSREIYYLTCLMNLCWCPLFRT